ncbi:hypothetical protein PIIN_11655 [Serendipita indica DSM 11827]|uniref:Uncharacterized protein n=1 Tax=Serendipita indica (strain DSM 11827) TaxID=1109443 RepID=G4U284_SERID|nr:hypothetical protein PIIN_11655 [Serendipita indica DSM 11827]
MWGYHSEKMYTGEEKIVIAFDIGTNTSIASYTHLVGGSLPIVQALHMYPESLRDQSLNLPTLPRGVSLLRIYKHFLLYMFKHTQSHFQSKIPNGSAIWNRLRSNMEFVFAIPINWDYTQQQIMCQAAIDAGLFRHTRQRHCFIS